MKHTALGALCAKPPLGTSDLQDKLVLITGSTSGIGLAAARMFAGAGAEVHVTGRNAARGEAAAATPTGADGKIIYHQCDLSTIATACAFETAFRRDVLLGSGRQLDIFVQNLACMPDSFELLADGHERTLSTNLLVFYTLGAALHPHIKPGGRVINVVSAGMCLHKMGVESLRALDDADGSGFDPIFAYCLTHRARVLLTQRWASQHPELFFASVHPGWVDTDGLRTAAAMRGFYRLMKPTLRSLEKGADTIAYLSTRPKYDPSSAAAQECSASGRYYWDRTARRVDLSLSGRTQATEADVDALVKFCDSCVQAGAIASVSDLSMVPTPLRAS